MVYFQGTSEINAGSNKNYTPLFHTDDLLSITVTGLDPQSVQPFNMPVPDFNSNPGGYATGSPTPPGYLIDAEGFIEFPVIGKLKIAGLDRMAVTALLKEKLSPYVKNPTISLRILNYKVTVLGEVRNPGTFTIPNERITLPEALGIAGDLTISALRKNILVVRDVDGKKSETRIDLTSKDLFSSPVYYLHQNDIVYVEPNKTRMNSSALNASNAGVIISIVSLLATITILLAR
ncbi:MAG: polysaccharide biosynthesis/export family protein [Bacteroidota bacterium]